MHSSKQERYSMSRFFKDRFAHLEAYTPGEQPQDDDIIKLNSNENPYQPTSHILAEGWILLVSIRHRQQVTNSEGC